MEKCVFCVHDGAFCFHILNHRVCKCVFLLAILANLSDRHLNCDDRLKRDGHLDLDALIICGEWMWNVGCGLNFRA